MLINIFASFVSFCFSCCFFLFHFFFSSLFIKCAVLLFLLFSLCHDIKLIRIYVIILICAIHGATLLSLSLLCVCVYAQQMEYFLTDASSLSQYFDFQAPDVTKQAKILYFRLFNFWQKIFETRKKELFACFHFKKSEIRTSRSSSEHF